MMTIPPAPDSGALLRVEPRRRPGWGGFLGAVVLTSAVLTPVFAAFLLTHYSLVHDTPWEGVAVHLFFGVDGLAGLGGVVMTTRDRNPWWLLATLVALGVPIAVALLVAQIGLISH